MQNILIYSTPTCPYCKMAKSFLKDHDISFTDIDVSTDANKAQEMIEKSGQMGVPVIDIDGEIIVGFDQKKISQLLHIK
ncbi:glutathione S-transferase N-terminal domain-containing protein [Candidatus Falkowbacteria bacterium]|nr:glutathione S-transferase N-terminal domain-containing protein [Candidatus Falkowbacteria bacterium]